MATPSARRPGLALVLAFVAVTVAIAVAFVLLIAGDDGGDAEREVLAGPQNTPFLLRHPPAWKRVAQDDLPDREPPAIAAIARQDGTGVLTVAVTPPLRGGVNALRRRLPATLKRQFPDAAHISVRTVEVVAGRALYASWLRRTTGRLQSRLVVSDGNRRAFRVDATIDGKAERTAKEVGAIYRTFTLEREKRR